MKLNIILGFIAVTCVTQTTQVSLDVSSSFGSTASGDIKKSSSLSASNRGKTLFGKVTFNHDFEAPDKGATYSTNLRKVTPRRNSILGGNAKISAGSSFTTGGLLKKLTFSDDDEASDKGASQNLRKVSQTSWVTPNLGSASDGGFKASAGLSFSTQGQKLLRKLTFSDDGEASDKDETLHKNLKKVAETTQVIPGLSSSFGFAASGDAKKRAGLSVRGQGKLAFGDDDQASDKDATPHKNCKKETQITQIIPSVSSIFGSTDSEDVKKSNGLSVTGQGNLAFGDDDEASDKDSTLHKNWKKVTQITRLIPNVSSIFGSTDSGDVQKSTGLSVTRQGNVAFVDDEEVSHKDSTHHKNCKKNAGALPGANIFISGSTDIQDSQVEEESLLQNLMDKKDEMVNQIIKYLKEVLDKISGSGPARGIIAIFDLLPTTDRIKYSMEIAKRIASNRIEQAKNLSKILTMPIETARNLLKRITNMLPSAGAEANAEAHASVDLTQATAAANAKADAEAHASVDLKKIGELTGIGGGFDKLTKPVRGVICAKDCGPKVEIPPTRPQIDSEDVVECVKDCKNAATKRKQAVLKVKLGGFGKIGGQRRPNHE